MNIYQKIVDLLKIIQDKIAPFAPNDIETCEWCTNRAICTMDFAKTCKYHPNNYYKNNAIDEKNEHDSSHTP